MTTTRHKILRPANTRFYFRISFYKARGTEIRMRDNNSAYAYLEPKDIDPLIAALKDLKAYIESQEANQ